MSRKILNQRQIGVLIRETVEKKIEEQQIKEGATAFRRSVLQNLAEEMTEKEHDFSQIEEGMMGDLWDKAKGFIGGSNKQQASFTNAVEKATNKRTQQFFDQLENAAPGFPNTKGNDKFELGLALLRTTWTLLAKEASAAESKAERITAAAAATDLANYAQEAAGDFSRTFKYMKEDEADAALALEALQEAPTGISKFININRWIKLNKLRMAGDASDRQIKWLDRKELRIDNEVAQKGLGHLTGKEKKVYDMMHADPDVEPWDPEGDTGGGGGGGGGEAPSLPDDVDPMDAADGQFPSPDPGDYEGQGSPWATDPEWTPDATPGLDAGIGIDAAGGAGEAAEAGGGIINVLGVPIATKLAIGLGLGVGAVVVGAALWKTYKHLQKKRAAGDSREGMLKGVVSRMKPVQPDFSGIVSLVPGETKDADQTQDDQLPAGQTPAGTGADAAPDAAPDAAQSTQQQRAAASNQARQKAGAPKPAAAAPAAVSPEWDSTLGAQPVQKDGESAEAYASRLKMAANARKSAAMNELKRLRQLAGIKILRS
jgi:hypothetical protein